MHHSESSNEWLDRYDLQALSEMRSETGPIFSLYLDLRASQSPLERFNRLLRDITQQKKLDQELPEYQELWLREAERIRRWLETEPLPSGEGLVVFSHLEKDLWWVFSLPVPVVDRLVIGRQPHTTPIEILWSETPCTLVLLIDAGSARWVEVFLGKAQEVENLQAVPVTGDDPRQGMSQHVQFVIERTEALWQERGCDRLVTGGSDETRNDLRDALPQSLSERLAGELDLSPQAGIDEILAGVLDVEEELEQRLESQRVEELLSNSQSDGGSVLGLEQTFLAVRSKKIRLLVAEEGFTQPGGECPNCGFLGEGQEGICLMCGMALRPEPDLVEVALKRVLEAGGEIEVLRSPAARGALIEHGQIGALIRTARTPPAEKDIANRRNLSKGGKVNQDALHDEAIEESFPASDPPSW